jgi:E3 ubiquitin-protein ligase UBR7
MFQCMGLGSVEDGGCGEDWWHPECLMGLPRDVSNAVNIETNTTAEVVKEGQATTDLPPIQEEAEDNEPPSTGVAQPVLSAGMADLMEISLGEEAVADVEVDDDSTPPGFPDEDTFEHVICYKCTAAFPWIKRYAGTSGFLPALPLQDSKETKKEVPAPQAEGGTLHNAAAPQTGLQQTSSVLGKRKAEDEEEPASAGETQAKKPKAEDTTTSTSTIMPGSSAITCLYDTLAPSSYTTPLTLFLTADFRPHLCRCPAHFPLLTPHPQLLEEEDNYEPPLSEASSLHGGAPSTHGSRSLLERGEAALSSMDRVRAIEGVMAYNHIKDKVKDFLKPYAESGQAVGAEEIRAYFERLRGDDEAAREAREAGGT